MYAAVIMMKLEPGHYDEMHAIATNAPERMRSMKGFISAVYYSDKEKDEFGTTTVWETKEDWEAYLNAIPSEMMDRLGTISTEPYSMNTYYVDNAFSA